MTDYTTPPSSPVLTEPPAAGAPLSPPIPTVPPTPLTPSPESAPVETTPLPTQAAAIRPKWFYPVLAGGAAVIGLGLILIGFFVYSSEENTVPTNVYIDDLPPEESPSPSSYTPSARIQLSTEHTGRPGSNEATSSSPHSGLAAEAFSHLEDLGPGAIIFGDYLFSVYDDYLIRLPLICQTNCPHRVELSLSTYTTPGQPTPTTVAFPLQTGIMAGSRQVALYQNDDQEVILGDIIFTLDRSANDEDIRDDTNFGQLTAIGLYLYLDNSYDIVQRERPARSVSIYYLSGPLADAQLVGDSFRPDVHYAGSLASATGAEIFAESTLHEDLGLYTHSIYAYFPSQHTTQPIFSDLTLLGTSSSGELVVYYPRTTISSPQIGLITINADLHGITGNQIIIPPEQMPDAIPDFLDDEFYFVTTNLDIYHASLADPRPTLVHNFADYFRTNGFELTNWWLARSNNNHLGVCVCSQTKAQKDGSGSFYDFQLRQFIQSSPDCAGRREVGTWYCA